MKTCTSQGCDKPHRARGLCSTHYNQAHAKPRHRKITVPCGYCGEPCEKEAGRTNRYANVYCQLICRDLARLEATGSDPLREARTHLTPRTKPTKPTYPASRVWIRQCGVCGTLFTARHGAARYCGTTCRNRKHDEHKRGRHKIRRLEIFERDQYECWMCDKACDRSAAVPHPDAPTVDHLTPRSLGGGDEHDNLATACFQCNSRRGASWDLPAAA